MPTDNEVGTCAWSDYVLLRTDQKLDHLDALLIVGSNAFINSTSRVWSHIFNHWSDVL